MTSEDYEAARVLALRMLERKPRSEFELRQALTQRQVPEEVAEQVVQRFCEVGLLNDHAYASAITRTRSQLTNRGSAMIRQELRSKGLEDEVVESAVGELSAQDELEAARSAGRRRLRSLARLDPPVARRRLYAALQRRGFSYELSRKVVDELLG